MRALAVAVLVLAACDPVWTLRVEVRSPSGAPIEGAAVGLLCEGRLARQSQATHSGVGGIAEMGSVGYFPACDVSVAAPDHETLIIRHGDMCPGDSGCQHGRDVEVTLGVRESASYRAPRTGR